jgi:hypothetical protein
MYRTMIYTLLITIRSRYLLYAESSTVKGMQSHMATLIMVWREGRGEADLSGNEKFEGSGCRVINH